MRGSATAFLCPDEMQWNPGGRDTGRSHGACLEFGFSVLPPRVSLCSRPGLRFAPSGLRGDAGLRNGGSVARMKCNGIRVGGTPVAPMARASNSDFLYSRLGFRCTPDPDSASLPPGYVCARSPYVAQRNTGMERSGIRAGSAPQRYAARSERERRADEGAIRQ